MNKKYLYDRLRKNEFLLIVVLILLVWKAVPLLMKWVDPQSGEFSIDTLYVPLIAGIYFFTALIIIWFAFWVRWPKGYKIFDDLFNSDQEVTLWQKSLCTIAVFFSLVLLYGICLLAVTGISHVMVQ